MGLKLEYKDGDTLLSPEELDMLIPVHITNRRQLDEVEQNNIEDAIQWMLSLKSIAAKKIFSSEFQDQLHIKMLDKVWKWAGHQRARETNIGVAPTQIAVERRKLNDDALFWFENKTWNHKEFAVRFHHRIIQIHCYPNGNGRHGRIMADLILEKLYKMEPLEWITGDLVKETEDRKTYIAAMKAADKGNYELLMECIKR
jgi:Fic-DOC domain mobile mystery protein B